MNPSSSDSQESKLNVVSNSLNKNVLPVGSLYFDYGDGIPTSFCSLTLIDKNNCVAVTASHCMSRMLLEEYNSSFDSLYATFEQKPVPGGKHDFKVQGMVHPFPESFQGKNGFYSSKIQNFEYLKFPDITLVSLCSDKIFRYGLPEAAKILISDKENFDDIYLGGNGFAGFDPFWTFPPIIVSGSRNISNPPLDWEKKGDFLYGRINQIHAGPGDSGGFIGKIIRNKFYLLGVLAGGDSDVRHERLFEGIQYFRETFTIGATAMNSKIQRWVEKGVNILKRNPKGVHQLDIEGIHWKVVENKTPLTESAEGQYSEEEVIEKLTHYVFPLFNSGGRRNLQGPVGFHHQEGNFYFAFYINEKKSSRGKAFRFSDEFAKPGLYFYRNGMTKHYFEIEDIGFQLSISNTFTKKKYRDYYEQYLIRKFLPLDLSKAIDNTKTNIELEEIDTHEYSNKYRDTVVLDFLKVDRDEPIPYEHFNSDILRKLRQQTPFSKAMENFMNIDYNENLME